MNTDKNIKNWKDYLEIKFSDNSIYTIDDKTDVLSNGVYTVTANGSETEISFIWPYEDWLTIDDIQFHNSKVNGWSGELLGGNGLNIQSRYNSKTTSKKAELKRYYEYHQINNDQESIKRKLSIKIVNHEFN